MANNSIGDMWARYRSIPIVYRIGAAFVLGSVVGLIVGEPATVLQPLGDIFLRLLSMIAVPIVIFTLLMGVRQLSPATLGKIGAQVVGLYAVSSVIAVGFGLLVANFINPGTGLTLTGGQTQQQETPNLVETLLGIIPENPANAIAEGNFLAIIFFVLLFGIGLVMIRDSTDDESLRKGAEGIFRASETAAEAMFKMVWGVLEFGVIGIFALMAATLAQTGAEALVSFAVLIATLAVALLAHIVLIYLVGIIGMLSGQSPISFLVGSREAMVTALSTRSSSGTLPVTMSNADENLRVEEGIYSFSLPLGATINMDGTAMYMGIAAVFAANLAGVSLSIAEQLTVIAIAVLTSIGAAGVPGVGLIILTLILTQLGLPLAVVGFVAGVDPILDRMRTMTNVTGDLAVTTLVGNWNGAVDFETGVWGDQETPSPTPTDD